MVELDSGAPEEWDLVLSSSTTLLSTQAKDLEVASWLTEALVRLEGFPGLRDGLTLITGLVERFWEGLFPEADEDGLETKVGPVSGLSGSGATGTLSQPIRTSPITRGSLARYSLWHYEQAADLEKIADPARREARVKAGTITMEKFRQSVRETSNEEMQEVFASVEQSQTALAAMSQAFRVAAGDDAPPTSALRDLLDQVAGAIRFVAADKLAVLAKPDAQAGDSTEEVSAAVGSAVAASAPVRRVDGFASRDEALAELTKIAAYFRKTEPHSPLSYTIDEAVRRGKLTLPELLAELAQDPAHIKHILLAAGIKEIPTS